jgi:Ca2+-binding EF-hand superfamily protein
LGDIAGKIMDELDTDGNGELSTDEINNGGDSAKAIQPADTNGDGVVTMTELIAYLSQTTVGSQTSQSQLNSLA